MIIHHPDSLHERIANRRSNKLEPARLKVLAHRIRLGRMRRNPLPQVPRVHPRLAPDELPDIAIERSKFLLHSEKCARIGNGRLDLQSVANNPLIAKQRLDLAPVVARNFCGIKAGKSGTIVLALPQNRVPAQPGLRSLQNQKLKQDAIPVLGHAPFAIVIPNRQRVCSPPAPDHALAALLCHPVSMVPRLIKETGYPPLSALR